MNANLLASMLKQIRDSQTQLVAISKEEMTVYVKNQIDDGFGNLVQDPYDTNPTPVKLVYRIFHETRILAEDIQSPAGLSTNLARAIITDYENDLTVIENSIINYEGKKYRVGVVDPLKNFGGIYGYQATLTESGDV